MKYELKKIIDVADIISGGTPKSSNPNYFGGATVWLTPKDLSKNSEIYISRSERTLTEEGIKNSSAKIIPEGSVTLSSRAPIGYVAISTKPFTTNQGMKSFIPKQDLYNEYLYYYLLYSKSALEKEGSGTTFKEISKSKLEVFPIPIPTISEQKHIVSKIKECFTLLDKSEEKLKQAEEKLSLVINSSNKLFKTKTSNNTYTLSEVFKLKNGKFNPSSNLKNNFDTEFKFKVYGGNGVTGYFNKALVQGQTIIIGRVGAKCGSIHKSKEPVWVTDNALYIETFLKEVDLEFLYWKLISLNLNGFSDGTGQPKIDQSKIYSLTIDIPDTIEEQKRIARQFEITNERVNNSLAQIQSKKSAIQNIRQSILKKAFEGKLI